MIELFLWWWGIGAGSCLLAALYINWRHMNLKELLIIVSASAILGWAGPILTYWMVTWFWQGWQAQFAVDEGGRRLYPWRKD